MDGMISFITVSNNEDKVKSLKSSIITAFSGWYQFVPEDNLEIIHVDGTENDIFTGYNLGASQAKGEILAFVHDDVKFLCHGGLFDAPIELMRKPFTGFVGVAGSRVMPAEGKWWSAPQQECRGAVYHTSKSGTPFGMHINTWPHQQAEFEQVVICDGVLLMCNKKVFSKLSGFDSDTFKGFHLYDVDITLRAHLAGLQNYVAPIPLLHNSRGVPNQNWEDNRKLFVDKHKRALPAKV